MELNTFEEQIFFSTVRITSTSKAGKGNSIGTGFLYSIKISENERCIFLVSNRHVYQDPTKPIQLVLHQRDETNKNRPKLGQTVTFVADEFKGIFTEHPNPNIDLACINISQIGYHTPPIFYKNITDELLTDLNYNGIRAGKEICFIGYPENIFDTKNNLPIFRHGCIASIPQINFEEQPQFLIDAHVLHGSSGSPVFTVVRDQYKILGILSAGMIKSEKLKEIPIATTLGIGD